VISERSVCAAVARSPIRSPARLSSESFSALRRSCVGRVASVRRCYRVAPTTGDLRCVGSPTSRRGLGHPSEPCPCGIDLRRCRPSGRGACGRSCVARRWRSRRHLVRSPRRSGGTARSARRLPPSARPTEAQPSPRRPTRSIAASERPPTQIEILSSGRGVGHRAVGAVERQVRFGPQRAQQLDLLVDAATTVAERLGERFVAPHRRQDRTPPVGRFGH
jgi:hypothetical protein